MQHLYGELDISLLGHQADISRKAENILLDKPNHFEMSIKIQVIRSNFYFVCPKKEHMSSLILYFWSLNWPSLHTLTSSDIMPVAWQRHIFSDKMSSKYRDLGSNVCTLFHLKCQTSWHSECDLWLWPASTSCSGEWLHPQTFTHCDLLIIKR